MLEKSAINTGAAKFFNIMQVSRFLVPKQVHIILAFVAAIFLHIIFLLLLFVGVNFSKPSLVPKVETVFVPVELIQRQSVRARQQDLQKNKSLSKEQSNTAKIEKSVSKLLSKTKRAKNNQKLKLADLAPKYDFQTGATENPANYAEEFSFTKTGKFTASPKLRDGKLKSLQLEQLIYQTIDSNLVYPTAFKEKLVSGVVAAKLFFDANGKFQREESKIESTNPYLRTYIARYLQTTFHSAFPKSMLQTKKGLWVHAVFRFELTEHNDANLIQEQKGIIVNRMLFYRNHQHSSLSYEFGPFSGLFPLPSVSINPFWFLEKAKEALGKKKRDPLEKYRDDPEWLLSE